MKKEEKPVFTRSYNPKHVNDVIATHDDILINNWMNGIKANSLKMLREKE